MITLECTHCGIRMLVPPTVQGRQGICFGCGQPLRVPEIETPDPETAIAYEQGARIADRYIIESRIGKGGMGVVYKAHDELVDETVALKFLHPRLVSGERGRQLFIKEAMIARRLRHECIVTVHDVSTTLEGALYLSMEYMDGHSLRAVLRRHRETRQHVSVRLAVRIIEQTLGALAYAHRTVIHRDMKPENIMLAPGEHVKVLDFGLAKAIDEGEMAPQPAGQSGRVVGTYGYAAPEQKRRQNVDLRADLYAVGLVLRELLTLRTPVEENAGVMQVRSDVAPSIAAVIDKALEEHRDNRWSTANDFRNALLQAFEESYRSAAPAPNAAPSASASASTDNMALFEGGSFLMGNRHVANEAPEFEAHVDPFYMDIHPVTVAEYRRFLEETGHPPPKFWGIPEFSGPEQPVVGITWASANAYAAWAGKHLPAEAEWEFAARGKSNRKYPWGNQDPSPMLANYGDFLSIPSIVTMHEEGATPEGLLDMAGNVYEWTQDLYRPYKEVNINKKGDSLPRRVVRGGSWHSPPGELRCTFRKGLFPESQLTTVGFRCVMPADEI